MTIILENSDILQACATTLAGVLIFLTIERKLDLAENQSYISSLRSAIEIEVRKIDQWDDLSMDSKEDSKILKNDIEESKERYNKLNKALKRAEKRSSKSWKEATLKNWEDLATFITLSLLTSCILFLILVEEQWTFYFFNYTMISRMLYSFGLIALIVRVALRAKD